ncbi:hypothetical protein GGE07_005767 [Sinorhizobium terangae]|uniref:Uncharacterized protein n=1 Tax=Sinorhizobium terangae TaxID=110322 RepID=A0A6N7LD57_SINTE|nr:hypothetical protein [Sinorhizobium terangae]MBB4189087.1 hypothetical protein [Sinorhizobium terangae]MQX15692.1 hypothetical protein [Sinorhizobium terangae]
MKGEGKDEQLIEVVFRNGTLTVIGIVLSFSLGFLSQWAANPLLWEMVNLPTIVLFSAGIACQVKALLILIEHDSIKKRVYDRSKRWFSYGVIAVCIAVVFAVTLDFLQLKLQL